VHVLGNFPMLAPHKPSYAIFVCAVPVGVSAKAHTPSCLWGRDPKGEVGYQWKKESTQLISQTFCLK
jgi:hypothetical protein